MTHSAPARPTALRNRSAAPAVGITIYGCGEDEAAPEEQPDGLPVLGPAGTVAVFDARLWHRRQDNLGTRIRRAMFMASSRSIPARPACRRRRESGRRACGSAPR